MKKTKLILLTTLGICIISIMPAVVAMSDHRSISEFAATNDYVTAWSDPESNLVILPHAYAVAPGVEVISDCKYSGSVIEKELEDGRILYKVNLHVKDAWMFVAYMGKGLIIEGEMDYFFTVHMIIEGTFGGPIPNFIDVIYGGGEIKSVAIIGKGTGTFMDNDAVIELGYTPGATVKAFVFQVAVFDQEIGDLEWLLELVRFPGQRLERLLLLVERILDWFLFPFRYLTL